MMLPSHGKYSIMDQQIQQLQFLISKYDSMLNYMKQYNLIVSVCIRQPKSNTKSLLCTLCLQFDRCVQEYCTFYINMRLKHAIYFIVDPLTLKKNDQNQNRGYLQKNSALANKQKNQFIHKDHIIKEYSNKHFAVKLIFLKNQSIRKQIKYRMHTEIWKKNQNQLTTNQVLTMHQQSFMIQLLNKLSNQGFITHFSPNHAVNLCHKKPKPAYTMVPQIKPQRNKQAAQFYPNLLDYLKNQCTKLCQLLTDIYKNKVVCPICQHSQIYDYRKNMYISPTIKIQPYMQRLDCKIFHEQCAIRYLLPQRKPIESQSHQPNPSASSSNNRQQK